MRLPLVPMSAAQAPVRLAAVVLALGLVSSVGCGGTTKAPGVRGNAPTLRNGDGTEYLAHEVIIRVDPAVTPQALQRALALVGGTIIDDAGPLHGLGFRRVQLPTSITADVAISRLIDTGAVVRAEPNYIVQASATPNDTRFGELWGMQKISAPAAWDISTGSKEVLVAVSDTGIDYNHADLSANAWTNPGEIPGNGKDDDGNGYVDDIHGYDFANGDGNPMDDNGHGSHVSGTIGGVANNALGVAGLNWNVKIQGVKFLAANGSGSTWNGAQTILYAAKMKARVVNASWGCLGPGCYASYVEDAIKVLEQAGGIFIVAAGNNANNNDGYPAYPANYVVPSLVAVAASDSNDALASFSNYGATRVHVAAPGVGILSTVVGGGYASWNGTSMAAPHVAGAAALMVALRPAATPAEIKQKLLETCDPVAGLVGKVAAGGRINVRRLLASVGQAPAAPAGFDAVSGGHSDALLSWQANTDSDLGGYRLRWGTASGQYTKSLDLGKTVLTARVADLLNGTRYFFVVHAVSTSGLLSGASVEKQVVASDGVAPAQVVDLAASAVPGGEASGELVAASGEFSSVWAASNAHDGSPDTAWISAGRSTPDEESLTIGLFAPYLIDGVDLLPSAAYPGFFPMDFDIEVSSDSQSWSSVGGLRNATASAGQPVRILFPPTLASQVRLRVLQSRRHESGVHYAALAEMTIFEASSTPNALRLSFSAPGDDPGVGRAARYDIRRSTSPLTAGTFDAATVVPVPASPLTAGLREEVTVSPLAGETAYHFALKAFDAAGNATPMSNVATATTLLIPPSTITDLTVLEAPADSHSGMITLGWTAPGGDGKEGQAVRYDLRVAEAPMTPGDFAGATPVAGVPLPGPAGTTERFAVSDLSAGRTYYFAVLAIDSSGAAGGVSNVVAAEPSDGDDVTPPARVGELTARFSNATVKLTPTIDSVSDELSAARGAAKLLDGDVASAWQTKAAPATTPAWVVFDFGKVQPLVKFRANPSSVDLIASYPQDFEIQTSSDKVNWTPIVHVEGLLGKFATWNEWSAPVTYARYARLYITRRGPASPAAAYAAMGEFEAFALTPELDAELTWVSPGDDGYDGRAARYELRRSLAPLTDGTFAAGEPVATLAPLPGGMIEVLHLASLPSEATLYFALRAVDTTGNWSGISNVATLQTPGLPPGPIADLAVVGATKDSLSLGFTASGDDGNVGAATAYELRYATSPITPASWGAAALAPTGTPKSPGASEVITVAGLAPTTLYYFAIKAVDDIGNRSLLSNIAVGSTRDGTAPSPIRDLAATPVDPAQRPALTMTVSGSSGSYTPETTAKNLLDNNDTTEWISPASAQAQTAHVQFDIGASRRLGRLRMRAGAADRDLFPVDFRLEVQATAGGAWTTAVSETGFATQGGWEEWTLGSVPAVAARLTITRMALWTGKYTAALADLEIYEDPTDFSKLRLSWTAPGDDADSGVATAYDLRRAATPIGEPAFAGATPVSGAPKPQAAGYLERFEARDLTAESTHCFAIKVTDEEGNTSAVSNTSCATTPGVPPATITDLRVISTAATTATLAFTAPGGDGAIGLAARYELRRSTKRINTANWDSAAVVAGLSAPAPAGGAETITVTGLTGLTTYFFAARAVDEAGNAAALSNNATGATLDDLPPSRVADLVAATVAAQGGSLLLSFTAPGDNGTVGQAKAYEVRVSTAVIDASNFAGATAVIVGVPAAGGARENLTITGLGAEQLYYVALRAVDAAGNVSALSNVASARTREESPAAVTDLAIIGGSGRDVTNATLILQWTATGDDARIGTAQSYELRYATTAITAANFSLGKLVTTVPSPASAGTVQQATIAGLTPGTKYYAALRATDDRGNVSPLSNVATATTVDEVAPATTSDLVAATGAGPGSLSLSLTAPGDDGAAVGRATAYDLRYALTSLDAGSFASAAPLAAPAPGTAGVAQTFTVSGLPNETEIFLMLRTRDDAGNWSALSNVARATTPGVAPAAITDLASIGRGAGSVTLGWTATGDDGKVGTATATDLRYSLSPLTEATFAAGTVVPTSPPAGAGVAQTATATGLSANKTYYFAIKAQDDRGNWSPLSNVISLATEDTLAPGAITLSAVAGGAAGSIVLSWTATGDDAAQGTANRYELRRSPAVITAATWAAATALTAPAPKAAGLTESVTVTGLKGETTHHFAIRAVDEAGNTGPQSNDAAANTAPVAPAPAVLTAALTISGGKASATLSWLAPGDDGVEGVATAYDIRVSTSPITAANFGAATALSVTVAVPTPATAGTPQSVVVPDLKESTTYYFALKAIDDTQTWSAISNVPTVVVPDLTKPGAPSGLSVGTPDTNGKRLVPTKAIPSTVLGPSWEAANLLDGDATSSWASAGSDDVAAQSVVLDLGASLAIEQVKLGADAKYLELFPRAFTLAVSADSSTWKTVVTETDFSVTSAQPVSWGFPVETGRYVRLAITDTGISFDKHYAILADIEVVSPSAADGQAQLTWLATGDDGMTGKATRHEVFRFTRAFTADELGSVTPVPNPPLPAAAGQLQTMTVTALHGETTYFWAVRAVDEAGNVGPLSTVVGGKTNDVPPAAVRSLTGKATGNTSIDLTWQATGDDGLDGVATSVEIRYLAGPLSSQNFATATLVPGLPPPAAARTQQTVSVAGLKTGVTYRFGLVAKDAAGNASFLSNIATVATNSPPDTTAPAAISDLTVDVPAPGGKLLSGKTIAQSSEQAPDWKAVAAADKSTTTFWASAVRSASQEEWVRIEYPASATADRVRVWPSAAYPYLFPPDVAVRVSPDGLAWMTVATATNVTATAGNPVTLTFPPTNLRFLEFRATRLAPQGGGLYYAAVAEIETLTASEPAGTIVASWTSPSDDGASGRAASYNLRVSACPFDAVAATPVTTATPRDAGTPERARVTGKGPGTYCVAVRSTDAAGNTSALSNVATITLP